MKKIIDNGMALGAMLRTAAEIHTILGKYNLTLGVGEIEGRTVAVVMTKVPGPGKPMVTVDVNPEVWVR